MRGSSSSIILCLLLSVAFHCSRPPFEGGRLMMFCLLYGIGSMGAKKSLKREIREILLLGGTDGHRTIGRHLRWCPLRSCLCPMRMMVLLKKGEQW